MHWLYTVFDVPSPPTENGSQGTETGVGTALHENTKGNIVNLKKILVAGAAGMAIALGAAAPAFADVSIAGCKDGWESAGGGCFYHTGGGAGDTIKSQYYHGKVCHSATAKNAHGTSDKTVAAKKNTARASVKGTDDTDYAYWDNEPPECD